MTVARRDARAGLGAGVVIGLAGRIAAATRTPTGLHPLAVAAGMRLGSAFARRAPDADHRSFANPAHAALLSRGHSLLWRQPRWMPRGMASHDFGPRPARAAERMLAGPIMTVCHPYRGRITGYDVVDEAVNEDDGTRHDTAPSRPLGGAEATLDRAFHTARAAAPGARPVHNDHMSWEPGSAEHRTSVALEDDWRDRYSWIDGVAPREGGAPHGPCPHDAAFREKPMRAAIAAASMAVPERSR